MDNAGNIVDEEAVVDLLENASDYEHGQKILVKKLKELGGGVYKAFITRKQEKKYMQCADTFAFNES